MNGVWLVGVAEGGTLAVTVAATNETVKGVATLATPLTLGEWARETGRLLDYARRVGMMRTPGFPESMSAWSREVAAIDAGAAAHACCRRGRCSCCTAPTTTSCRSTTRVSWPRPAHPTAELRVVQAAGHELRHDPRAIAALLGWLDRLP